MPNMVPVGSLGIPLFEDTPMGRNLEEERRNRVKPLEIPEYKPIKFEPIKMDMPKYEPIKLEPIKFEPIKLEPIKFEPIKIKSYEPPPSFELFPKKNFWDKILVLDYCY